MKIPLPTFEFENKFWLQGKQYIAGVDEVGRGCFAGPVVAAAVILPKTFAVKEVNDSKLLTPKKREELAGVIKELALSFAIAEINVEVINQLGIGKATQIAFKKAIEDLDIQPDHILIDAYFIDRIERDRQTAIIKGDQKSISIAAASIIAKVYRDKLMVKLNTDYLPYDFSSNKGYGTKKHREAIKKYGLCNLHRTSFHLNKFL